ncbi:hypothetical protein GBF38_003686 [Nibea albiflora]|uniref:Uncharacterized protein n=1 Tax=Nibea albiflora TaxID=240163 RepID=A0ACB7F1R3_NIBAL|nr:hypothetical protein GBF38_003686 [Nibea albiflora]
MQGDQQDDGTQNSSARTTPHCSDDQQDANTASSSSPETFGSGEAALPPMDTVHKQYYGGQQPDSGARDLDTAKLRNRLEGPTANDNVRDVKGCLAWLRDKVAGRIQTGSDTDVKTPRFRSFEWGSPTWAVVVSAAEVATKKATCGREAEPDPPFGKAQPGVTLRLPVR